MQIYHCRISTRKKDTNITEIKVLYMIITARLVDALSGRLIKYLLFTRRSRRHCFFGAAVSDVIDPDTQTSNTQ